MYKIEVIKQNKGWSYFPYKWGVKHDRDDFDINFGFTFTKKGAIRAANRAIRKDKKPLKQPEVVYEEEV